MRFEGGRVRTTCWSRTTTHTMATLDTRGLVEAPIWFVVFLLLCVAIPVLHDLHGTQRQFRRKERSVDKRERGRNGEGATTRAACRGGKPSCAVSSSIGPSSRSSPATNKSVRDIMDDTYGPRRLSQTRRDSRGLCTCILSSLCTQVRERSCCVRTLNERSGGCLNHQTLAPQSRKGAAGRGKSNFCRSDSTTVFARSPPQPQPVVVGPYMSIFELFYYLIDVLLLDVQEI